MRVAFVTSWFGESIPGGAEAAVRDLAVRLHRAGLLVEVLTTCIRDFHADWSANHHQPGVAEVLGLPVRRFNVERRAQRRFDRINKRLMFPWRGVDGRPRPCSPGQSPLSPADEQFYIQHQIRSPDLFGYLDCHRESYDIFVLMPYMFATTYYGVLATRERSVLIPALHDEPYAYMSIYRRMAEAAGAIATQTRAEHELVARIFGRSAASKSHLLGMGIETMWHGDGRRFRKKYDLSGRLFLYAGRRDEGKGVYRLVADFLDYRAGQGQGKLLLIGPGELPPEVGEHPDILDLGFVDPQDKYDAYAAADVFIHPSRQEAFSIVLLESWLAGTPALIDGRCRVTREHCQRSAGGLWYDNPAEFAAALDRFAARPDQARAMADAGRKYVLANYLWPVVIDRYRSLFDHMKRASRGKKGG